MTLDDDPGHRGIFLNNRGAFPLYRPLNQRVQEADPDRSPCARILRALGETALLQTSRHCLAPQLRDNPTSELRRTHLPTEEDWRMQNTTSSSTLSMTDVGGVVPNVITPGMTSGRASDCE